MVSPTEDLEISVVDSVSPQLLEFSDIWDETITSPGFENEILENSDIAQFGEVIDPVSIQINEINVTTSPISPVIATPTKQDLENDFHNYIQNFSTPRPLDSESESINSASQSPELSATGNETVESELGPDSENAMDILKKIRIKNLNRITIATLNINSLASKFEQLREVIGNNIDILTIQETKLDSSFPIDQFIIDGKQQQ